MAYDLINIKGLDKAAILAALFNNAKPVGFGLLQGKQNQMTLEQAREYLKSLGSDGYVDYLYGRPLKVDLSEDKEILDPYLYDRDQGSGLAAKVITRLRINGSIIGLLDF